MTSFRADLKVVVADKNMQATFAGLLTRHQSLRIQPLQLDPQSPLVHPRHDPGCWKDGPELLAIEHNYYRHGLLALDWEGCNSKRSADETRRELQERLDRLTAPGWGSVVVLQPPLPPSSRSGCLPAPPKWIEPLAGSQARSLLGWNSRATFSQARPNRPGPRRRWSTPWSRSASPAPHPSTAS